MAETDLLQAAGRYLRSLLSPREAEAGVAARPELLPTLEHMASAPSSNYLAGVYGQILRAAAQADPTVMLTPDAETLDRIKAAGVYDVIGKEILYRPDRSPADIQGTLAHELLHYLAAQSRRPLTPEAQHAVMRTLLGSEYYQPWADVQNTVFNQANQPNPWEHLELFEEWLKGQGPAYRTGQEASPVVTQGGQ